MGIRFSNSVIPSLRIGNVLITCYVRRLIYGHFGVHHLDENKGLSKSLFVISGGLVHDYMTTVSFRPTSLLSVGLAGYIVVNNREHGGYITLIK